MNYSVLALLAVLTLSACGTSAAPAVPGDDTDDGGAAINQTAGLGEFPGADSSEVIPDGDDSRTLFDTDAPLSEVYAYFDGELVAQGWQRTELETDDDEIEAEYVRAGRELEFELEREDSGRYELEIDIDGDNDSYDQDNGPGDDDDDSSDDGDDDGDDQGDDS